MLPEELKKLIGVTGDIKVYEVEKGSIARFADAVDDMNPLYHDAEYARNSRFGSIITPPGFFGWPQQQTRNSPLNIDIPAELMTAFEQAGYPLSFALDGAVKYEFFEPVHAGAILNARSTVRSLRERTSNGRSIIVCILETTYHNQKGILAATQQSTFVRGSSGIQQEESDNV
jgi:acyl dehydratase